MLNSSIVSIATRQSFLSQKIGPQEHLQVCLQHKHTWNLTGAWFLTSIVPLTGGEYTPIQSLEEGLSTFSHVTVTQSPDWASSVVLTWREMVVSAAGQRKIGTYMKLYQAYIQLFIAGSMVKWGMLDTWYMGWLWLYIGTLGLMSEGMR